METQAITNRLPLDLYELLRAEAFARRVTMNSVVVEALRARLEAEPPAAG